MRKITTPVGDVPTSMLKKICALAGFWIDPNGQPVITSDLARGKRTNPANERKANEKNIVEHELWLPIKYNNFLFAKAITGNLKEAVTLAEKELFKNGRPVFLPKLLSEKNPFSTQYMSYARILKLCSNVDKDNYSKKELLDYWHGRKKAINAEGGKGLGF